MYNHAGAEGLGLKGLHSRVVGPSLLFGSWAAAAVGS